nr:PREDICTED: mediator of RNA polymerase II transcription subunit 12-like [Bemisia tabaci]
MERPSSKMILQAQVLVLLTCLMALSVRSTEVGVPERFLKPRNYNPHPYEDAILRNQNLQLQALQLQLPQAAAPYALFHRKPANGDVTTPVPYPIPPVILKQKPEKYKSEVPSKYSSVPKNYAFSYAVKDKNSGDDFSHSQAHNGLATKGEYRVKLPDGRVQIVSYTADNNGYRADVRYEGDPLSSEAPEKKPTKKPQFNFDKFHDPDFAFSPIAFKGFKPFKSIFLQPTTTPPPAPQAHHTHESQMQTLNKIPESSEEYPQVDNYSLDYYENNFGTQAPDYQNSVEEVNHQPEVRTPEDPFRNGYRFPYRGSIHPKVPEVATRNEVNHQVQNDIAAEEPAYPNPERVTQTVPIAVYPVYSVTQPNYDYDRQVYSEYQSKEQPQEQHDDRQHLHEQRLRQQEQQQLHEQRLRQQEQQQLHEQQLRHEQQQLTEQRLRQEKQQLHKQQIRQDHQQLHEQQLRQEHEQLHEQQLRQEQLHQQQLHQQIHQQQLHQQHHTEVTAPKVPQNINVYYQPKYVVPVVDHASPKPGYISTPAHYDYQTTPAASYEQSAYTTAAPTTVYRQLPSELSFRKVSPDLKPVPEERVKIQPNSEPHEDSGSPDYIVPPAAKPASQPADYQEASGSQEVSIVKSVSASLASGFTGGAKRSYPVAVSERTLQNTPGARDYPAESSGEEETPIKRSFSVVTEKSSQSESKGFLLDIRRISSPTPKPQEQTDKK